MLFHRTHQPTHDNLLADLLAKAGDLSDMWKISPPDYLSGDVRGGDVGTLVVHYC